MSTVAEVIAARARGVKCVGLSTITNMAAGLGGPHLSHQEVLEIADSVKGRLSALVRGIVAQI
jgi:purine-nucleoside phosphorylase